MIIAVTYDNGVINQHFGKTQYMKIYETQKNCSAESAGT